MVEELSDEQIIEIRDNLLPPQGERFDTLAFARAIESAAIAELEAKVRGMKRDAERLELLVKHEAKVCFSRDGDDCWVMLGYDEDIPSLGPLCNDWREAIDQAMEEER